MGKFFKRNFLLDLIHILKFLIYFANNDTKLAKISIKIQIFVKKFVIADFDSVVIKKVWVLNDSIQDLSFQSHLFLNRIKAYISLF